MNKGLEYELYINDYLNSNINDHIKISYMWKDVPEYVLFDYGFINDYNQHRMNIKNNENPLQDIGTDILYINQEDECVIVQCKNYSSSVRINDLAGFYYIMSVHHDKRGEIYYTSSLSRLINESKNIKYFKKEIVNERVKEKIEVIKPYNYQQVVIDRAAEYYKDNESGVVSLPCGTGKTLIGCYIGMSYDVVVFVTPLKQYAKQNINRFLEYEKGRKCLLIDSDGTRNAEEVCEFVMSGKRVLLSCTYRSCDIIVELISKIENVMIIFDEFHNFSRRNIYDEEDSINRLVSGSRNGWKKLYLSATPRVYELENGGDDVDVSEVFGSYIYQMSFNEAIEKKYICDYELYLPVFELNNYGNDIRELDIHKDYLQKILFLIEAIKMFGVIKVIVYVRDHKEVCEFIKNFSKVNEWYGYDIWIDSITCEDSYKMRDRVLCMFNEMNKISVLVSVHILDEAIDVRSCNAVYMTYSCKSKIKNVQRMSRALRWQSGKIARVMLYCVDVDESLDFMSSVREYDVGFVNKIRYVGVNGRGSGNIEKKSVREERQIVMSNVNRVKVIGIELYRSENWFEKLEKVKRYMDENGRRPTQHNKDMSVRQLGGWIRTQTMNFNKKLCIMKDKNIRNVWYEFINDDKYQEYFISTEEEWYTNLEKVKEYIDTYNKRPTKDNKDIIIKQLGNWVCAQKKNFNEKSKIMKNKDIYNIWYEFINNDKYQKYFLGNEELWYDNLNKVKDYIDKYKKRPTSINKDITIKQLGTWITIQTRNFNKKLYIMKNENIYNIWYKFTNDSEYKEYFISNKELWYNNLEKVKDYINTYKKRPSQHKKDITIKQLGNWIGNQSIGFKKKIEIMKDENIYNTWYEFINDSKYQEYFK